MTTFNVTISETIRTFGPDPANQWSQFKWNAFHWGEGENPVVVTIASDIEDSEILTDSISTTFQSIVSITELLAVDGRTGYGALSSENGYLYVFPSNVTDAENIFTPSYTTGTTVSTSWATGAAASTSWT